MDERRVLKASFDGACEPFNPGGHMGLGWMIDGAEHYEYIAAGPGNTNNVAEYRALIRLLESISPDATPGELVITGDSALVLNQVSGEWKINSTPLGNLCRGVSQLINRLEEAGWTVCLSWVDRSLNTAADRASKAALLEHGIESARRRPEAGWTPLLGDIAKPFDISAVELGKVLGKIGLRGTEKEPTPSAITDGYARQRFDGRGFRTDWQIEKVTDRVREHFLKTGFTPKVKREPVAAEHLCRHTTRLGLRPSRKQLDEVRMTLCTTCRSGNIALYRDERASVLRMCEDGEPLVDAVELIVEDLRLRPAVFMAAWGRWFHDRREALIDIYRDQCEKPGRHPEYLAKCEQLERQKQRDLERLMRAAIHAD